MEERKYRMLRRGGNGPPFPWTEILAQEEGMIEVFMTQAEILGKTEPQQHTTETSIELKTKKTDKPGPGWVKNQAGSWKRKVKK